MLRRHPMLTPFGVRRAGSPVDAEVLTSRPVTASSGHGSATPAGSGVVHPLTDARGVQHVVRDILLER